MSRTVGDAARTLAALNLTATLGLGACASAPKPTAPAPALPPQATQPAFTPKQMAPIPNPAGESAKPPAAAVAPPPTVKHPAPKPPAAKPPEAAEPNPIKASQLRAAGLIQLNRGAIARAVALLREANQTDPDNRLIQRDLERALRISRAVSAKP